MVSQGILQREIFRFFSLLFRGKGANLFFGHYNRSETGLNLRWTVRVGCLILSIVYVTMLIKDQKSMLKQNQITRSPSIYQCIRNSKQQYGKHKAHSTLPWSKVWFFLKQVILLGCCCLNVTLKSYSRSSSWGLIEIAPLESFMSDALKCETKITSKSWMLARQHLG